MSRPSLTVIKGDWVASSPWLDIPQTVAAASPFGRAERVSYRIAREDAIKAARNHRRQPIFELWSIVLGRVPPVLGSERKRRTGLIRLENAHACFRGIKRPCAADDDGAQMLAYVLKPHRYFVYSPGMGAMLAQQEIPNDLVFVVYVRLDEPCVPSGSPIKGVVTHWQFVEADEADPSLPVDHKGRYGERLW